MWHKYPKQSSDKSTIAHENKNIIENTKHGRFIWSKQQEIWMSNKTKLKFNNTKIILCPISYSGNPNIIRTLRDYNNL